MMVDAPVATHEEAMTEDIVRRLDRLERENKNLRRGLLGPVVRVMLPSAAGKEAERL